MTFLDVAIVILYFVVVIGLGCWFARRAANNMESYFLGGQRMHWLALAMSGSVSNFDITGTMWIVSIIMLLGMKSMWHHWMWGFLLGAFFMSYMGKWVRRSNVMTAAEWMKTRFGEGPAGRMARMTYAVMAILYVMGTIGYAYQGISKFAPIYIPLARWGESLSSPFLHNLCTLHEGAVLAVAIMGITTLYVMMGGLLSVVVTDVIQTIILTLGAIFILVLAWMKVSPEQLRALPEGFTSLSIPSRLPEFAGTENAQFVFFGALVLMWVIKGLLLNAGGPGQMYDFQRFLAAGSARDASKIGAAWSLFLVVRWGMAMGIALMALTGVAGITDPEQAMPVVLREFLPTGVRGLVLAGLLAAFMSTFSSTVNSGASFIVRDLLQAFIWPKLDGKQAIRASYIATVLLVASGVALGMRGNSIAQIWNWIMMALTAAVIVPNVLRWYWWRLNGWGYAWGTLGGIALSFIALIKPEFPSLYLFPIIVGTSLLISVVVSWLTAPVEAKVLATFYRSVRPFGVWAHVREESGLTKEELAKRSEHAPLTIVNVIIGMMVVLGLYLFPMYFVGHWYGPMSFWLTTAVVGMIILKFTWYENLPED